MKLSVTILCVPGRRTMAKVLQKHIESLGQPVNVFCDIRYQGCWYGVQQARKLMDKTSTHHLVLQEDVLLCNNFFAAVEEILKILPHHIISFYNLKSERAKHDWATKKGYSWVVNDAGSAGPAILMPADYVYSFLKFSDKWVAPETKYEESRLWGWQKVNNIHTWVSNPNLVEHLGSMSSTLGFNSFGKTAVNYIGDADPLSIDWTKGAEPERIFEYMVSEHFIKGFKGKITHV